MKLNRKVKLRIESGLNFLKTLKALKTEVAC